MDNKLPYLFENSQDFFCVIDSSGKIIHVNDAARKTSGYALTELIGKRFIEFYHPADISAAGVTLEDLIVRNQINDRESRIKSKNGRYFNIRWSLLLDPSENLVYATGIDLTQKLDETGHNRAIENIQHIVQSFNEGFFIMDSEWKIKSFNPAFQAITGLTKKQLIYINFREITSLGISEDFMAELEIAFNSDTYSQFQYFNEYFKRWMRLNIYPYRNEVTVLMRDITNIKNQQQVLALEKHILELNASSSGSLVQTIDQLLMGIEEIFPGMFCSVLEVDDAQEKIYHLSAPRLPTEYCKALNGLSIGPATGSCGTAAYHRSQIIVSDIANDPLWANYKEMILPYGFKACWSTPIISSHSSKVLATFAVYYTETREPRQDELHMIDRTTNILRILIENNRNQQHVKEQTQMLQEIAAISSHEIRRPVATILGLVNLFDREHRDSLLNVEIIDHLDTTARELDNVIHTIVEKTVYLKSEK